jgi:hypothetical protein
MYVEVVVGVNPKGQLAMQSAFAARIKFDFTRMKK